MPAAVVVGAQWGDEGKGKIVDLLAPQADLVIRYAGGANAGHTLVVDGKKVVLHLIPSGILHPEKTCIIGQGCVVDLGKALDEIDALKAQGHRLEGRLIISDRAHVVLPHHKLVDGLREAATDEKIGTTKRGIGPAYEDKIGRRGVRVGDLLRPGLESRIEELHGRWSPLVERLGGELPSVAEVLAELKTLGEAVAPFVGDAGKRAAEALEGGARVLLEGAQGTLLDIDHGTYPFVTSSNASAGGACTGSGIGPTAVNHVIGIAKAYTTRVGGGPFPTELHGEAGEALRQAGAEFGATTGRPRRCGWFDAPALRHAVRVNGMTSIALTKLDVLAGLPELKICTGYRYDGEVHEVLPFGNLDDVEPVYETLPGWSEDVAACRRIEQLPENAQKYLRRLEELVGCPLGLVSVGPGRNETIGTIEPFSH